MSVTTVYVLTERTCPDCYGPEFAGVFASRESAIGGVRKEVPSASVDFEDDGRFLEVMTRDPHGNVRWWKVIACEVQP